MFRVIFFISLLTGILFAQVSNKSDYVITEKQKQGEVINIEVNSYKILQFSKRITDITLNSSENVSLNYTKNGKVPFTKVKVFAKKMGKAYALVTFMDKSITQINFNVVSDIKDLEAVVRSIGKNVSLTKINENIVLKGTVKNNKDKNKIIDIVKNYQKDIKIVDLIKTIEPNLMVKMKLYVAEIENGHTKKLSNEWSITGFNDGKTSADINADLSSIWTSAVTTTGGISAIANRLGSKFNVGWTLNFLASKNIARVLDESELMTQEGKKSVFHAGGSLYVAVTRSTADGLVEELQEIDYGLKLDMKVNEIINNEYVDLTITTSQDKIDEEATIKYTLAAPPIAKQSIETHVIVKDKNTIVLGGLINKNDAKRFEKVPLLGDIPVLGELFKSKNFVNGKSELVFFIVPEIVDPQTNSNKERAQSATEYYESKEYTSKIPNDQNLMK